MVKNKQIYLSSNTPYQYDENEKIQGEYFTLEFLKDIKCSGIPNHNIKLKTISYHAFKKH